ncbi:hypothetical protein M3175_07795 [Robertmurraya korlensis]|uniref:hypothetical protein n=1 Tax=Robertmurraya korlensis TaxID=519977 RepID=UPI00203AC964|nr:hypothetical protein [Robertmurraya korlensis]MCM3600630.1 hypothetical protein [Robertmurraya korlensis]
MPVKTSGLTANSPLHYLMNAGAVYKNLTYDELTGDFTGTLLGATSGGNEFALAQEIRNLEVDGAKGPTKGNVVIDSETATLTVNLKELTASNIALAIAGSQTTSDTNYDIITSKKKIELSDYLQNIAFVGRLSGSSDPVVIVIDNAISLEGLTVATTDKNEAIVPVVFTGHEGEDGTSPYKIYWPKVVVA